MPPAMPSSHQVPLSNHQHPRRSRACHALTGLVPLIVSLSACALPESDSRPSDQIGHPNHFSSQTIGQHATLEPAEADWLATFNDPNLTSLVAEALRSNWSLVDGSERLAQARLLAARAGAALEPSLDAVASASRADVGRDTSPRTSLRVGVAASWEIDVWGRLRADQRRARAEAQATEEDFRALRLAIASQTAQTWVLLTAAAQQIRVDEDLLAVRNRTLRVAESRLDAGVAQPIDVSVARADVRDSESLLTGARNALADAKRSLEVLLGRYPAAEISAVEDLPTLPARVPVGLPSDLLERRPDIRAADRRVAAAFDRVVSTKAARLPRLALTGEFGTASTELRDVLNPENAAWNLGANLLAPVFDGDGRRIDVKVAESQQRQALARYADTALRAFAEVETALSAEATFTDQQAHLERAVDDLTKARDAAELRYRRGLLSIFELTQIEARLFAARRDLVAVRSARIVQRIELHKALGGGFAQPDSLPLQDGESQ